jgi:hypothetical protein
LPPEVCGTDIKAVDDFLIYLDDNGILQNFCEPETIRQLLNGERVSDDIFLTLGTYYNVNIWLTVPGSDNKQYTYHYYDSGDSTRNVHIAWTDLDKGHWVHKPMECIAASLRFNL